MNKSDDLRLENSDSAKDKEKENKGKGHNHVPIHKSHSLLTSR